MNTKIIYISGSEVFEMADIRAAFDEVRSALGLGPDTILFGVPVDSDGIVATPVSDTDNAETVSSKCVAVIDPVVEPVSETMIDVLPVAESFVEPVVDFVEPAVVSAPDADAVDTIAPEIEPEIEPIVEPETDKVIPILSVLSVNDNIDAVDVAPAKEDAVAAEIEPVVEPEIEPEIEPVLAGISDNVSVDVMPDVIPDSVSIMPDSDSVKEPLVTEIPDVPTPDMIKEEIPVKPVEKTLEHLLESMTPLREDLNTDSEMPEEVNVGEIDVFDDADTDSTLAQLASEYVENEDKISPSPQNGTQSKIGVLKNMLPLRPFKKTRREDSSLMGDLFNWAGVAANDDDFAFPGFLK